MLYSLSYDMHSLVFQPTNAVDRRGDLALGYLCGILTNIPDASSPATGGDMFGDANFSQYYELTEMFLVNSPTYYSIVTNEMLPNVSSSNLTDAQVRQTLSGMLKIEELTVRLDGKYHETLSAEALDATIRATSNKLDPAFAVGLHAAIGYGAEIAPSSGGAAASSNAALTGKFHFYAVVWDVFDYQSHECVD